MGNRHVHEIECLQRLGTSEFGRQKVTALNLFYPTASPPPLQKAGFLALRHSLKGRGLRVTCRPMVLCPSFQTDLGRALGLDCLPECVFCAVGEDGQNGFSISLYNGFREVCQTESDCVSPSAISPRVFPIRSRRAWVRTSCDWIRTSMHLRFEKRSLFIERCRMCSTSAGSISLRWLRTPRNSSLLYRSRISRSLNWICD